MNLVSFKRCWNCHHFPDESIPLAYGALLSLNASLASNPPPKKKKTNARVTLEIQINVNLDKNLPSRDMIYKCFGEIETGCTYTARTMLVQSACGALIEVSVSNISLSICIIIGTETKLHEKKNIILSVQWKSIFFFFLFLKKCFLTFLISFTKIERRYLCLFFYSSREPWKFEVNLRV